MPAEYSNGEDERTRKSDEVDELLTGNPEFVKKDRPDDDDAGDKDDVKVDSKKKDDDNDDGADDLQKEKDRINEPLVELERLAVILKSIVHDCLVVPKGL